MPITVWIVALLAGVLASAQLDGDAAHRCGAFLGGAIFVLCVGWVAFRLSRRAWVASLLVIFVLLANLAARGRDHLALQRFLAEVRTKVAAAWQMFDELGRAGGLDPTSMRSVVAIDERLAIIHRLEQHCRDCAVLVETDDRLRATMVAGRASQAAITKAMQEYQASPEVGALRELLQSIERLLRAGDHLLTVLREHFGRWHVADDGTLAFDAGFSAAIAASAGEDQRVIDRELSVQDGLSKRLTGH